MLIRTLFLLLALSTTAYGQPEAYHCTYDARHAAAKQTTDTAFSENGDYAYTLVAGEPLVWLLRTRPVIEWWGATNMSTAGNNVVTQAFQDWEDATGIDFVRMGDFDNAIWPKQDGTSQMLIADPSDLGGAQGLTQRFLTGGTSPSVIETDIGFDPNLMAGSNEAFQISIARHEIGHLLGLQHVDKQNSLMFATILTGAAKAIDQGSLDGITFLYGDPLSMRNLVQAYADTLGTGIQRALAENAGVSLAQVPGRPGEVFAAIGEISNQSFLPTGNAWYSADGGNAWVRQENVSMEHVVGGVARLEGGSWFGLDNAPPVRNYTPAPDDGQVLYGSTDFVVYRSDDAGINWTFLGGTPFVSSISGLLVLNAKTVFIGTNLGVYKTVDSGENWVALNEGMPDGFEAEALANAPGSLAILYAGGIGGVFKSGNGGIAWSRLGSGLGATRVHKLRVGGDGSIYAVSDIGAFKLSSDEATWERLGDLPSYGVNDLLVDADDPTILYAATRDGILRSTNSGASFTQVFPTEDPIVVLPSLDYKTGDIEVGKATAVLVDVRNDGTGPLVIDRILSDVPGIVLPPLPITVAAGTTGSLRFTVTPEGTGAFDGIVTFFTNDPLNSQISAEIAGTGIVILADARADFDGNGAVDFNDFLAFAGAFGTANATYDIDASGTVDFNDFLVFAGSFGRPLA